MVVFRGRTTAGPPFRSLGPLSSAPGVGRRVKPQWPQEAIDWRYLPSGYD